MTTNDIRRKFLEFYKKRGHTEIPSAPLVPENDPTTLFTSSGMQPLIPYLLGQSHPSGKRLVNSQKAFRAQDIDEVGDNRHTTFFEMLGNWSLGDYFKKEQLPWIFEFLTSELGLDPKQLFVTVFEGNESVPKDEESARIWKSLGVADDHIFFYGVKKNWWSRSGEPEKMPAGELGGPDSEVFFDFGAQLGLHEKSPYKNEMCHPNCDCGRFMEIANSVFMQYKKEKDGSLQELVQKNVDFGGGLERMAAAAINSPDVFQTDLFTEIIKTIEEYSNGAKYSNEIQRGPIRIIADHLKAATFLIADGVVPSNKERGYVLRRLLRRAAVKMHVLRSGLTPIPGFHAICESVLTTYDGVYFDRANHRDVVDRIITDELERFVISLDKGLREFEKLDLITGKKAFDLYQTYGFPLEITHELAAQKNQTIDKEEFKQEFEKHKELSRSASKGMFKGGLADQSEQTTKLHTAHHLFLAAIQKIVDPTIKQRGSNITAERLRIDFNFFRKLTDEELRKIEVLVNEKIKENLSVSRVEMSREIAEKIGAQMEFGHKYPEVVSVYIVGSQDDYFSAEFCGGPHVSFTGALGHFTIKKEESAGAGIRRVYAALT